MDACSSFPHRHYMYAVERVCGLQASYLQHLVDGGGMAVESKPVCRWDTRTVLFTLAAHIRSLMSAASIDLRASHPDLWSLNPRLLACTPSHHLITLSLQANLQWSFAYNAWLSCSTGGCIFKYESCLPLHDPSGCQELRTVLINTAWPQAGLCTDDPYLYQGTSPNGKASVSQFLSHR